MGKWLGGIITALVILALTSLVGSLLKGPIEDLSSRERLTAEVQLSPWFAKPTNAKADANRPGDASRPLEDSVADIESTFVSSDDYQSARIIITNESSKKVSDVNFRLLSPYRFNQAVVIDDAGHRKNFVQVDRIFVPDLNPGDKAIVYIWGNYNTLTFADAFRTYSSAGSFRVRYDWPRGQQREFESAFGKFMDDWAGWIVGGCILLLLAITAILAAMWDSYAKALLKDDAFYKDEHDKYLLDPKKFQPDFSKVS